MIIKETETKILDGNDETVIWSAACLISDLFGKGELILSSAYASPSISSRQINQISDSSQPNNCIQYYCK